MSDKNTGGPAFPTERIGRESGEYLTYQEEGMTLRDYFAAKAMQGILVGIECDPATVPHVAESAYILADAMLKARDA
jgi:hypothetical protein